MEMVQEIEFFHVSREKIVRTIEEQDIELKTLKADYDYVHKEYSNLYNRSNLLELENKKILEEKRALLSEYKFLNDKCLATDHVNNMLKVDVSELVEKLRIADLISSDLCKIIDLHIRQLNAAKKMICGSSYV
jgi:predicted nuclease with TOPRIM domain